MKYTTKAQTEIVGLVIIAVIAVILILFLSLKSANSGATSKLQTLSAETAQAFLGSVMNKKTECGPSLENIIKNCYSTNDNCKGACQYARIVLEDELKSDFEKKGKGYHLSVEKNSQKKIDILSQDVKCGLATEKSGAGIVSLPDFPGVITIELELC